MSGDAIEVLGVPCAVSLDLALHSAGHSRLEPGSISPLGALDDDGSRLKAGMTSE